MKSDLFFDGNIYILIPRALGIISCNNNRAGGRMVGVCLDSVVF